MHLLLDCPPQLRRGPGPPCGEGVHWLLPGCGLPNLPMCGPRGCPGLRSRTPHSEHVQARGRRRWPCYIPRGVSSRGGPLRGRHVLIWRCGPEGRRWRHLLFFLRGRRRRACLLRRPLRQAQDLQRKLHIRIN